MDWKNNEETQNFQFRNKYHHSLYLQRWVWKNTFLKIQGQDPTDKINITIKSNHDDGLEKQWKDIRALFKAKCKPLIVALGHYGCWLDMKIWSIAQDRSQWVFFFGILSKKPKIIQLERDLSYANHSLTYANIEINQYLN